RHHRECEVAEDLGHHDSQPTPPGVASRGLSSTARVEGSDAEEWLQVVNSNMTAVQHGRSSQPRTSQRTYLDGLEEGCDGWFCPPLGPRDVRSSDTGDRTKVVTPLTVPRPRIPNPILPSLRMQRQYSQQDLANRLTEEAAKQGDNQTVCDARMVRRWENGDVIWPQEKYRILLEKVFEKPSSDLGFVRKWTRTSAGWTVVSAAADDKVNSGEAVRAAGQMFFEGGPVTVAIPLRKGVVERERVLIAAEDSATADHCESILTGQTLASARTTITPDSTELPTGHAIVVCGPKSAPVGACLLDRDPCLGMIEECGQWSIFDRITGERHPSPSDGTDHPSRDVAYFARHLIDGRTILHIAGIHAIGSLGMVHYLARNLTGLSSTFGDASFSLATTCDYDDLTITGSALLLGPHRW
ncbi:MAG: hypothetical protein LC808_05755, partial [Actinobacteria bacterium]|nr:hypothetical protein [Actinomycetota bacterium]